MKIGIEIYIISVLIVLLTTVGTFMIVIQMQTSKAREFHEYVKTAVENSMGSEQVITESKEQAGKMGYILGVEKKNIGEAGQICQITLSYEYSVPFVQLVNKPYLMGTVVLHQ